MLSTRPGGIAHRLPTPCPDGVRARRGTKTASVRDGAMPSVCQTASSLTLCN